MAWRVELDGTARRDLSELPPHIAAHILRFLNERLAKLDDPRQIGKALSGRRFAGLWKYRVGDYRIVAEIKDSILRIVVVRIGHRREVYREQS